MCGIVGIYDQRENRPVDRSLLHRMNESQHHRGPDEGGMHVEPGIGLGHRRLSIIDLKGGHQPLFNEDQTVAVVFNGEIYNFRQLTAQLEGLGHCFGTHCDTEVIVHAWEEWGEDCVSHFRGMFAFAVWDRNRQTLFLARDRLGIKPLYFARLNDEQFVFASELKALLQHPGLSKELDPKAVEEYFALGYVPDPRTILKQVRKLSPGHVLTLRKGRSDEYIREYWNVPFSDAGGGNEDALVEEFIERFSEAVNIRLISEVPLGAFLSGGADSSSVVAMMARASRGEPVNTCSISFGNPEFNESRYAKMVSDRYGTSHMVRQVNPEDYGLLGRLARIYDEPFADSSAIPTFRVCELARERVTVALSGDGGDENFAGYRRHRWHMYEERVRRLAPQWLRGPLFGAAARVYPKMDWAPKPLRAKTTLEALSRESLGAYMNSVSIMSGANRTRLFSPEMRRSLQGYDAIELFRSHAARAPTEHPLSIIQYIDMKTYLPGDILTKVDRASMANSLEVRVPMLDHHFVEWAAGVDPAYKLKGREGKHVLKRSMEKFLPREVLYREKMGFGVPLSSWFRGPLKTHVRDVILGSTLADTGLFSGEELRRIVDDHQSGLRERSADIWALLMFEGFIRNLEQPEGDAEGGRRPV